MPDNFENIHDVLRLCEMLLMYRVRSYRKVSNYENLARIGDTAIADGSRDFGRSFK